MTFITSQTPRQCEVFPYLLVRYASGQHTEFDLLKLPAWCTDHNNLEQAAARLEGLKNSVCDELHQAVGQATLISEKQALINLKRDIYNDRTPQQWENKVSDLSSGQRAAVQQFIEAKQQLASAKEEWVKHYNAHLLQARAYLQHLSTNDLFRRGIRLSSKELFEQLDAFARAPVNTFGSRQLRQEYSLLRYMTRMFFKTSPFGTFTHLGLGTLATAPVMSLPQPAEIKSNIRINNHVFDYLKTLLTCNDALTGQIHVRFNPTIRIVNEQLSFLINFHNIESFQKLPLSPVLEVLLNGRKSHPGLLRLGDMVAQMNEVIDATPSEIKSYLTGLIEVGLMEYDFFISGIAPDWDTALINYLKNIPQPTPLSTQTITVLQQQQNNCNLYAMATSGQCHTLLQAIQQQWNELFDAFLEPVGLKGHDKDLYKKNYEQHYSTASFKKHPYLLPTLTTEKLLYEDSFTTATAGMKEQAIKEIVEKTEALGQLLAPVNTYNEIGNSINTFFLKNYGADGEVNLLTFYQAYATAEKTRLQNQSEKVPGRNDDEYKQEYVVNRNRWIAQLKTILHPIVSAAVEEVQLTKEMLAKVATNQPADNGPVSRAMFAQLYVQEGQYKAVINGVFLGMGRAGGRFLHLFPAAVTQLQREWNNTMAGDAMLMELTDGSYFNANFHPPLLPYELRIPDGHNSVPVDSQVAAEEMAVYFDEAANRVALRHVPTRQRIIPYDLCLQSLPQRSKLYQLLAHFTDDAGISFAPLQQAVQQAIYGDGNNTTGEQDIYYLPRIVYEQQLVVKRRSWRIRTTSIPQKAEQQTDADYFRTLHQWRKANTLPGQVFLYLKRRRSGAENNSTADDYKPQYICFDTPLLVILWYKLLRKAGEYIYLEEMLPHSKDLHDNPVNEVLVQWYIR